VEDEFLATGNGRSFVVKRPLLSIAAAIGLLLALVPPIAADSGDALTIMVMKHACAASIQTEADFKAVEAKGEGNPVHVLAQTVLACPTTAMPGDAQSPGAIAADPSEFEFTVTDSAGTSVSSDDATFMAAKLCETDVELDANGDGTIAADVCLDTSHYVFTGLVSGEVTVEETSPPSGREFGTLRFTPTELQENNDEASLVGSMTDEPIKLDTSGDTDDMVMLHVYNFKSSMPATDTVESAAPDSPSPFIPITLLLAAIAGAAAFTTRLARRP